MVEDGLVSAESGELLAWDCVSQSITARHPAPHLLTLTLVPHHAAVVSTHTGVDSPEAKSIRIKSPIPPPLLDPGWTGPGCRVLGRESLGRKWEAELAVRSFVKPAVSKGGDLVILASARRPRGEQLELFHTPTGTRIHKYSTPSLQSHLSVLLRGLANLRIPVKRKGLIQSITGMPHNPNHVLLTSAPDSSGLIVDLKAGSPIDSCQNGRELRLPCRRK